MEQAGKVKFKARVRYSDPTPLNRDQSKDKFSRDLPNQLQVLLQVNNNGTFKVNQGSIIPKTLKVRDIDNKTFHRLRPNVYPLAISKYLDRTQTTLKNHFE